jgi:hypothetical protein
MPNFFSQVQHVEGGGLQEWEKNRHRGPQKVTHEAPSTSKIQKFKNVLFFLLISFFFDKSTFPHNGAGPHPHPGVGPQ